MRPLLATRWVATLTVAALVPLWASPAASAAPDPAPASQRDDGGQLPQTVTFPPPPSMNMPANGNPIVNPPFQATASSGLPITYGTPFDPGGDNVCSVGMSGQDIYVVVSRPGTCWVTAIQAGDSGYGYASAMASFEVLPTSTAPTVSVVPFKKIVAVGAPANEQAGVVTYPITVEAVASDDSGSFQLRADVYANGSIVDGYATPVAYNGKNSFTIDRKPPGKGPFYVCFWAIDLQDPMLNSGQKNACTWLSIEVPIASVSNGCGSDTVVEDIPVIEDIPGSGALALLVQNTLGNKRRYGGGLGRLGEYVVDVSQACNVHDAGYAGVTVFDPVRKKYYDFRTASRKAVDTHFAGDIQLICERELTERYAQFEVKTCRNGMREKKAKTEFMKMLDKTRDPIRSWWWITGKLGAQTYLDIVRNHGAKGYDADVTTPGGQYVTPAGGTTPAGGARTNN